MGHSVALQQHHAGLTSTRADLLSICMELEKLPESTHSENLSQRDVEVLENQRWERTGWRGVLSEKLSGYHGGSSLGRNDGMVVNRKTH